MIFAVLVEYGGYLSSPSFSANQVRSLFRIGWKVKFITKKEDM